MSIRMCPCTQSIFPYPVHSPGLPIVKSISSLQHYNTPFLEYKTRINMSGNPRRSDRLRERPNRPQYQEYSSQSSRQSSPQAPSRASSGSSSPQAPSRASSGSPAFAGRIRHPQQMANEVGSWTLPAAASPFSLPRNPGGSFGVRLNPPGHNPGVQLPTIAGRRRLPPLSGGDTHPYAQGQDARSRSGTPQSPGSARSGSQGRTPERHRPVEDMRPGRQIRPPPRTTPSDPTGAGPVRRPLPPLARQDPREVLERRLGMPPLGSAGQARPPRPDRAR